MDIPEVLQGRATVKLWPTTGNLLDLGKNATYRAAQVGEIPTLRLGHKYVVPVPKLLEMLGYDITTAREDVDAESGSPPRLTSTSVSGCFTKPEAVGFE